MNVRSGSGFSYGIIVEVKKGECYLILKEDGDWVQIQFGFGEKGWVVFWFIIKEDQVSISFLGSSDIVILIDFDLWMRSGLGIFYEVIGKFL